MFKKAAAILAGAALTLSVTSTASAANFTDVPESHSLHTEIEYLANEGVIGGYSDGTFKPNAPIAKKHIAKMLVQALELPTTNLKPLPYKDIPKTHAYYTEIAAAYTAGIFGDGENFKPESSISRAFMAKMLSAAFDLQDPNGEDGFIDMWYEDIDEDNEFLEPIWLVTANHIAQGTYIEETGGTNFLPNKLLTRAHFSAFLARAMSLQTDSFMPNPDYTYYYGDGETEQLRLDLEEAYESEKGAIGSSWNATDLQTGDEVLNVSYDIVLKQWGLFSGEYQFFADHPFTIGVKHDYSNESDDYPSIKFAVLDTDGTYEIGDTTFEHVVVLYEKTNEYNEIIERTYYIAKDYGIVAIDKGDGIEQMLMKRELRQ